MDPNTGAATESATEQADVPTILRSWIREGRFVPGQRLGEVAVAEALGLSRTPIRLAFRTLAEEGLLQPAGKRGFEVRAFSDLDVHCAVEVRGVLEGLAARRLAEAGPNEQVLAQLQACVEEGERVTSQASLGEAGVARWSALNSAFHHAIVDSAGSRVIADAIARNNHLPFASADSITIDRADLPAELERLRVAQLHHRLILDALRHREAGRVEALMREHALVGLRYAALSRRGGS